jgi:hypothetical protein
LLGCLADYRVAGNSKYRANEELFMLMSQIELSCYGDEEDAAAAAASAAQAAEAAAAEAAKKEGEKVFRTQAEVNAYLAEDRRKTEAKFKAQQKIEMQKQEATYNTLLANKNLSEQERDSVREQLEAVEKQLHTEKELMAKEKKKIEETLTARLTETQKNATDWENRYRDESVKTTLQAAVSDPDVYNPRQMVMTLKPYTKLVPVEGTGEFQVVVDLEDEVDGKPVITRMSPEAAVKRMKELPLIYGGFFKTNVVAGVGGNSGAGAGAGTSGKVDISKLSQTEYRALRKAHPEQIYGR